MDGHGDADDTRTPAYWHRELAKIRESADVLTLHRLWAEASRLSLALPTNPDADASPASGVVDSTP